jgi:hypothetical protein
LCALAMIWLKITQYRDAKQLVRWGVR